MFSSKPHLAKLVLKPHDPLSARRRGLLLALLWLLSLGLSYAVGVRRAAPEFEKISTELGALRHDAAQTAKDLEATKERLAVVERSDQVSRAANGELESNLKDREEELAALRTDLAFYQRLVGGGAPREGLAVHALAVKPIGGSGGYSFRLTLMQNLKKGAMIAGDVGLTIDGVRNHKLLSLDWQSLLQDEAAKPINFGFKYFQQLDGSVMLPPGFEPSRIKVIAKASDGQAINRDFAWADVLSAGSKDDAFR